MKKVKILIFFSVGLCIINLLLIWFLISQNPEKGKHSEPKQIIIERLHFDEQQIMDYEKLIGWHKTNMGKSEEKMRELKNTLYANLGNPNKNNDSDSLINELGNLQKEIEQINYTHFQDMQQLCKPEQQQAFNALSLDIAKLFAPPPHEK